MSSSLPLFPRPVLNLIQHMDLFFGGRLGGTPAIKQPAERVETPADPPAAVWMSAIDRFFDKNDTWGIKGCQ